MALRVGGFYAASALALLGLALLGWPLAAPLLWPAAALAIVAAGYFGLGPGVFGKVDGRLPWGRRLLLAPVVVAQRLSVVYYRRRCQKWDEVAPRLFVGRALNDAEAAQVVRSGATAVLDLTAELSEAGPLLALRYRNLPVLDLTPPTPEQLREAVAFIGEETRRGVVYLHCKLGLSRSATVACAYLIHTHQLASVEEALAGVRRARPGVIVRGEALAALRDFAAAA